MGITEMTVGFVVFGLSVACLGPKVKQLKLDRGPPKFRFAIGFVIAFVACLLSLSEGGN